MARRAGLLRSRLDERTLLSWAQTNESLRTARFKQPSHSGDATRPRAAGKSLYSFPESVPYQPAFAYPARGGFGRRDNRKCTGRGVASDGAHPTRSRGRASRGGSFRPNARRYHFARDSESRYVPVSSSASGSRLALPSHTSRHGRIGEIWARNRREKLLATAARSRCWGDGESTSIRRA